MKIKSMILAAVAMMTFAMTATAIPVRLKFYRSTGFYLDEVLVRPVTTDIEGITASPSSSTDGRTFNLLGQQVSPSAKGIVIRNGKKYLQK